MQLLLLYFFLFLIGCMLGYGLEVLFRRFVTAKKWVNPGFMKGPWLPLYGFGVILMLTICLVCESFMVKWGQFYNPHDYLGLGFESGPTVLDLIPIAIIGVGMTVLEFLAGLIFVKGFHVRLWDYRNMKGNVMGIICPLFSVLWFLAGIAYYYGLNPFVSRFAEISYVYMFGENGKVANVGFIFALGLVYGIMLVDFVKSCGAFSKIAAFARSSGIEARYEQLAAEHRAAQEKGKQEFLAHLPTRIKEELEKPKQPSKAAHWVRRFLLIDPDAKKDTSENYDEHGRPISTKDEK